jgi:hypothetical protein
MYTKRASKEAMKNIVLIRLSECLTKQVSRYRQKISSLGSTREEDFFCLKAAFLFPGGLWGFMPGSTVGSVDGNRGSGRKRTVLALTSLTIQLRGFGGSHSLISPCPVFD